MGERYKRCGDERAAKQTQNKLDAILGASALLDEWDFIESVPAKGHALASGSGSAHAASHAQHSFRRLATVSAEPSLPAEAAPPFPLGCGLLATGLLLGGVLLSRFLCLRKCRERMTVTPRYDEPSSFTNRD